MKTKNEILEEKEKLSELLKDSQDKLKYNKNEINIDKSLELLNRILTLRWVLGEYNYE